MALGFGKVTGTTALGRPLDFSVNLRFDVSEVLEPGCVGAEVIVGDRPLRADQVRARLVRVGSSGERRIRVTTTVPVDEPTLNVTVHAGCPAQLSRGFVVFADPPQMLAQSGDLPSDPDAGDDAELRAASPLVAAVPEEPAHAASRPAPRSRRPVSAERRDAAAVPPIAAAAPARPRKPRPAPPPPAPASGPVLKLDPPEEEAVTQPNATLGAAPPASGIASAPAEQDVAQRLADQARLKALEASVQQLRERDQAKERALGALQAQLRAAEHDRYANPVTYVLAGLCAVLAVALAGVLLLRRRDRLQAEWWAGEVAAAAAQAAELEPEPVATPSTSGAAATVAPTPVPDARAPTPPLRAETPPPPPAAVSAPPVRNEVRTSLAPTELRRPMSAEELIDLEQQVDFFVVLGQDEAAIDLLMGHVRSTSGVSPLPYLKLLEIYRRRDEREPYERIRERFNRRFNAYAPEWGVDPEAGRDLAGYPEVLERLQELWCTPSDAMELLDTLLFRRDVGPTFDVPAYRELLFLYGIARDQAERDFKLSGVDLLLPLGDDAGPGISPVVSRPSADGGGFERITLDLDVSTDLPPTLTVEVPPAPAPAHDDDRLLDFQVDEHDLPPRR